ncbi:MAG: hypothetical protein LBD48_11835, partial [Treponema sp.]|nr:hypothetical protein [Treponema sp.]
MFKNRSLRFKISVSVGVYILVFGIIGNVLLYVYLLGVVSRKAERLDHSYLEAVRLRIERNLADVFSLAVVCANDPAVLYAVSRQERADTGIIRYSLDAQERLNAFLQANPISAYIDKLILFDNHLLFVQASARQGGASSDPEKIRQLPLYSRFIAENLTWASGFGPSITSLNQRDSCALLFRMQGSWHNSAEGYLYVEVGLDIITDVFRDYEVPPGVFAQVAETGEMIFQKSSKLAKQTAENAVPADVS